ncbi:MAG: protein kinase [Acidobacteriota bacterium]
MSEDPDTLSGELQVGETIRHYEILGRLGAGGMGVVYRARDRQLDRTVALKFLPPTASGGEEARRFVREARAASALDHPNICTIHAIDETADGRVFIAMAAYDGETLRERLRLGPLAPADWVDVALQTARGLAAAHSRGIIHRDIKPANLMITRDGLVKVLDFGLSKLDQRRDPGSRLTRSGTLLGTVGYVSPEQVRGEEVGPASDIWSLGVVLYEMASGRLPFGNGHDLSVLYEVLHAEPEPLRELVPNAPRQLTRIVERALAREVERRYGSMDAVIADLEELARGLEVDAGSGAHWTALPASLEAEPPTTRISEAAPTLRLSSSAQDLIPGASSRAAVAPRRSIQSRLATPRVLVALVGALALGLLLVVLLVPNGSRRGLDGLPGQSSARSLLEQAEQHLRGRDGAAAARSLQAALELEPEAARLHLALAESLELEGDESGSIERGEDALSRAQALPVLEQRPYRAHLARLRGDLAGAAEHLEVLWRQREASGGWRAGERLEVGLSLTRLRAAAGDNESALELLAGLRPGDPPDPRLALTESVVISEPQAQLEAARRAVAEARRADRPLVEARARFQEGRVLRRLGELDAAADALDHAAAIYERHEDRLGQADTATTRGNLAWDRGDLAAAKELYEHAAQLYGAVGNERLGSRALTNKALVLRELGDLEASTAIFRQALELQRALGDRLAQIYTLINTTGPMVLTGRLAEAATACAEAEALAEELDEPSAESLVLEAKGGILILRGELVQARNALDRALVLAERAGDRQAVAYVEVRLGRVLHLQGEVISAREGRERALETFRASGDLVAASLARQYLGETLRAFGDFEAARSLLDQAQADQEASAGLGWAGVRLSLAELLLAQGESARALAKARQSVAELGEGRRVFETVRAHVVMARALAAEGDLEGARAAIERAAAVETPDPSPTYSIPTLLAKASIDRAAGSDRAARESLQAALAEATIHGFLPFELQARLQLGELELRGGSERAGRARLERVVEEADRLGLGVIARDARRLLG